MIRVLPAVVELGLLIFCLIDCIQQPDEAIRNLPKWGWVVLIIIVPLIGSIAYLVAGRPQRSGYATPRRQVPWPSTRTAGFPEYERPPRGPDDDDEYLRNLSRVNRDDERMLRDWEADLRRREEQLKRDDGHEDNQPPTPTP